MITLTVTSQGGFAQSNLKRGFHGNEIKRLRPSTEGNLSSAAIFDVQNDDESGTSITYVVSETYSAVLAAVTADTAANGAIATSSIVTTFATTGDTTVPSSEAVLECFQPLWYGSTIGQDTYVVSFTNLAPTAYYAGMMILVKFATTNTGASTINVNSLGAKAIRKGTGGATALSASDLVTTKIYTLIYDGTNFQINL